MPCNYRDTHFEYLYFSYLTTRGTTKHFLVLYQRLMQFGYIHKIVHGLAATYP